jgi:hypothetical protein
MHMLLPWFLPLSTGIAWVGSRTAIHLLRHEKKKWPEVALAFALAWFPLLIWIVAQFASDTARNL